MGRQSGKGYGAAISGDYATALREWRPLAEQGDADAQASLGVMYENGSGVPQDYAEAVRLFRLAAEQGLARAQYSLGYMYLNGLGVPKDCVLAYMWFNLAAAQDALPSRLSSNLVFPIAAKKRDIAAGLMTPAQIAEAQRRAREWQEAHQPE